MNYYSINSDTFCYDCYKFKIELSEKVEIRTFALLTQDRRQWKSSRTTSKSWNKWFTYSDRFESRCGGKVKYISIQSDKQVVAKEYKIDVKPAVYVFGDHLSVDELVLYRNGDRQNYSSWNCDRTTVAPPTVAPVTVPIYSVSIPTIRILVGALQPGAGGYAPPPL